MKVVIVALALVALAAAIPVEPVRPDTPKILHSENDQKPGGYRYGFESDDGTSRSEEGTLKEVKDAENKLHSVYFVRGTFTYINDQGKQELIRYEADENGFRAYGDSIPKPLQETSV